MLTNSPKYIRDRFYRLRSYAWYSLFPKDEYLRKLNRYDSKREKQRFKNKVNDIVDEVALILLIFFLRKFFADGTKMAIETVDLFKQLNLDGFWVGGVHFADRNDNVMMGATLANRLYGNLSEDVKKLIENKNHPFEIVDLYKEFYKNI